MIKRRRQLLGWDQRELAELVGVHVNSVQKWEAGTHYPGRKLGKLEAVLGISLSDDQGEPDPIPEDLRAMIRRDFPPERAENLLDVMEGLLTGRLTVTRPAEPPSGQESPRKAG